MTTGEKLSKLRKEHGYTQEQLAEVIGVSRQAVSRWESDMAFPETDKLIRLSSMYGCSVDYLLMDKEGDNRPGEVSDTIMINDDDAGKLLKLRKEQAPYVAGGVLMCILSPALLILLAGFSETRMLNISEGFAVGAGMTVLLLMVAAAVFLFISYGMKAKKYEFMENSSICVSGAVRAKVTEMKNDYEAVFAKAVAAGAVLCIISVIPLVIAGAVSAPGFILCALVSLLLVLAGCGVYIIVRSAMIKGSFDLLLQEGDYSEEEKTVRRKYGVYPGVYWLVITAVYLGCSFITGKWDITWIIWPVAGVLFAALAGIMRARALRTEQ